MRLRRDLVAVLIAVTCVHPAALGGQDSSYILSTRDPVNPWPTQIGNGRLALNTSSLGTAPTYSYMAGIFDHATRDTPRPFEREAVRRRRGVRFTAHDRAEIITSSGLLSTAAIFVL